MGKILIVAEKPSVARDIARVLGVTTRGEGFISSEKYVVTWAIGHLVSLKEPEELDERLKRWRAADLPILPEKMELKVLPKTRSQFSVIKKLMNSKETDSLICATDSGREGELIFRYIYDMAVCKKPFERLWISSMTDEAIRMGFDTLKPGSHYDALYESARCRSEADWLVGMNASRAFTLRYQALLSVGRVQTPTLQMLVKRRKEIDSFLSEPFYTVQADFGDYQGTWFDPSKDGDKRITEETKAKAIAEKVKGQKAIVQSAQSEEKRELPPQLYDLTTLQREASSMLGFTADKTLKTAQALYEKHKLITYPRTDSRYLSHDMGPSVKKALQSLGEPYAALAAPVLSQPIPQPKRIFDDTKITDHHAIIPTGRRVNSDTLSEDERKLFDLVARRLIAAFYPAYLYHATKVITQSVGESFVSNGTVVLQEGFKQVYRDLQPKKKGKNTEEAALPPLGEGEERTVRKASVKKDQTKPPKEHTDASLLSEMEHAGRRIEDEALREQMKGCSLGTPATRAAIIERLIAVGYAKRKGRSIMATEKGVRLIEAVPAEIASPETTGKWEQALEKIAQGKGDSERFMEGIRRLAAFLTGYAAQNAPDVPFEREERSGKGRKRAVKGIGVACPVCKEGQITENEKAFGCSRWRDGCKFTIWKDAVAKVGGPQMNAKLVKALLESETGDLRGSSGVLHYRDGYVTFTPKK